MVECFDPPFCGKFHHFLFLKLNLPLPRLNKYFICIKIEQTKVHLSDVQNAIEYILYNLYSSNHRDFTFKITRPEVYSSASCISCSVSQLVKLSISQSVLGHPWLILGHPGVILDHPRAQVNKRQKN